ncbi:MAG: tRNA-uridine aminocarboxypropyltransferase [Planctomycetota bacterium]
MGRSVVLAGAARCPRCSLPPRWCTCDMLPPVVSPLAVHVLVHRGEQHKPSSTGTLVARAVTGATRHLFQRETRFFKATGFPADAVEPGRELWILHPGGDPLPTSPAMTDGARGSRQPVLLLDGTWRQAGEMLRAVERVGRCVRLQDASVQPSRYWLRDQPTPTQLSTAETLMGVFHGVGEHEAERSLRLHFELHVYATLLARGKREMAERYLGHSPLLTEAAEVLDRLHGRWASDKKSCRPTRGRQP